MRAGDLFAATDRLLARAPTLAAVRFHGLQLFEAERRRRLGLAVPAELAQEERLAGLVALGAPALAERVRAIVEGRLVVVKGPECAAAYPDPRLRPYWDLDLLAEGARAAHASLLAAGFSPVGDPALYDGIHHLRPLVWNGLPLAVELHEALKWPAGLVPPALGDVLEHATGPSTLCDGVLGLAPGAHSVVLAAHSWAHVPLRRAVDLLDLVVVSAGREEAATAIARAWGIERLWLTSIRAAGDLFGESASSRHLRVWARDVAEVRQPTVLGTHLRRWLADFGAVGPARAATTLPGRFARELRPLDGESRRSKAGRVVRAVRDLGTTLAEHDRRVGAERSSDGRTTGSEQSFPHPVDRAQT